MHNESLKENLIHQTNGIPCCIYHNLVPEHHPIVLYLHWHEEFEFILVTKGTATFYVDDRSYSLQKGEGLFIHPHVLHSALSKNNSSCSFLAIVFHPSMICPVENGHFFETFLQPILSARLIFPMFFSNSNRSPKWQKDLISLIKSISCCSFSEVTQELTVRGKLLEAWGILFSQASPNNTSLSSKHPMVHEQLRIVLSYINEHYSETISLDDLANLLPVSKGYLCKIFKETFSLSPISYLVQFRLSRSCQLLRTSCLKISAIASQVGFSNISYYNREFHKLYHLTPTQYRRREIGQDV